MAVTKCCCFDLRTGTLIQLWMQALSIVFGAFQGYERAGAFLLPTLVGILGLYGVYKEKPDFLWPSLICSIIGIVVSIIGAIIILFMAIGFVAAPFEDEHKDSAQIGAAAFILVDVLLICLIALMIYFYKVVKAYFNQMHEESAAKTQNNMDRLYPKV